ncbi:MAG: hypothetical protein CL920_33905 [Deltaproteobacteria bacterium]|nr:hypothetical protein [Deltaproteobacteria bacterium]MBU53717.1 hypothetical protein [Deltaproteobacteria bacterium]
MDAVQDRNEVSSFPFKVIYLLYCLLFGFVLFDIGFDALTYFGVPILFFVFAMGFRRISEGDVPLTFGAFYGIGVTGAYMLYIEKFGQVWITIGLLIFLFVMGILGNVVYFLGERQKLSYLNGQISEEAMTMRKTEKMFPLWLIIFGNIFLIFGVTPLLWALLYDVTGTQLFWIQEAGPAWGFFEKSFELQPPMTLFSWFGYVLGNVNQSFLGVASLLGIEFSDKAIVPTGIGKGVVLVFRLGTISLALGAVKRYLDLRSTTQRLVVALGRSASELGQREEAHEGKISEIEDWRILDGRRHMWQIRLRQLLHLYPAQVDTIVNMLSGGGLLQIKLKSRGKDKYLVDYIRGELAELLEDPVLYANAPSVRYDVLRALLRILEKEEDLHPFIRRKATVTLAHLVRPHDRANLKERVYKCIDALCAEREAEFNEEPWRFMEEQRAVLAANYGLIKMGHLERMPKLLPALRQTGTVLQDDSHRYIEWMSEKLSTSISATLMSVQRMMEQAQHADQEIVPVLEELQMNLKQLKTKSETPYRKFAAYALAVCLKEEIKDPAVQAKIAKVLLACGARFAVPMAWKLFRSSELEVRELLLDAFISEGMEAPLVRYLETMLAKGSRNKQILSAWLLGRLPASDKNRSALCAKAADDESSTAVRWMALRSIAQLGHPDDLVALKAFDIPQEQERLWAAWSYACYRCGDANGLVSLVDVLATRHDDIPLREAAEEILTHGDPEEGPYASVMLDPEEKAAERVEASEHIVTRRSPLALLALGHVLNNGKKYPKKLRQNAAEDLGILGRSLHVDDIHALGNQHAPAEWAAPPLLHALEHDGDRLVRIRAARALGRLGLSDIRQKFEKILIDPDENAQLRQVVAQAVGELGDATWMSFLLERFPVEKSLQVKQGMVRALDLLGAEPEFFLQCLEDESNAKLLQLVLQSLAQRPLNEEERGRMLQFLGAGAKEVRAAAADVLGAQSIEEAIEPLCECIDHEKESVKEVRRAAIKALRRLALAYGRQDEIREHVERTFREDPDHLVVQDTASVYSRLYGQSAGPLLLEALEKRDEREPWKKGFAGIVRSLGNTRWPDAGPRLYPLLEKELNAERTHLPRLISLIRPVGLASGADAKDMLINLVDRNDPAFSWIAADVIAELGDPSFIPDVEHILNSKRADKTLEPNLEAALLFTLVRLGVWERLSEFVNMAHDAERPVARRRALGMMPGLKVGLSSVALLQAMDPNQTPNEKLRETAVNTMGQMAGRLDVIIQALRWQANSDPRAKVREAAQSALRNINFQVQEALFEDGPSRRTSSPIVHKGEAIHPVFKDVFQNVGERKGTQRRIAQPVVPVRKPTKTTTTTTTPETTTTKKATKKPAKKKTHLDLLIAALGKNDHKGVRRLLNDDAQAELQKPLWQAFSAWVDALDTFQEGHKGWAFSLGNPGGNAQYWPFLIMDRPVSRREYLHFCQETGRSLPEGWKPDAKQLKYPNNPVSGISWWDAKAYAEHHGWELPTYEQLLLSHSRPVFEVSGAPAQWSASHEFGEWSETSNKRRRQLIQAYPPPHSARSSFKREERASKLTFRCVKQLNCSTDLMQQIVAWQLHLYLPDLLYSCAFNGELSIPASLDKELRGVLRRPKLKIVSADLVQVDGQAEVKREETKPKKPPKPKVTSTDKFWKRLDAGNWKKALNILRAAPKDLDPKLQRLREPLEALWSWYDAHEDMLWINGQWNGTAKERPFLLQERLITRGDYADFCKKNDVALPRNLGRSAKKVSEPQSPVTGITLYEAKFYADANKAEVPTIEFLQRANQTVSLNAHMTEWTSSPYRHNRQLVQCFSSGYNASKRKTYRLDERKAPVGFRLMQPLTKEQVPEIVITLIGDQQGASIKQLPERFNENLKQHLNQLLQG